MNILEIISTSKYFSRTPQLNESDLSSEVDDALPIDFWSKSLNMAQDYLLTKVAQSFQDYFTNSQTISYSAGTNEYDIPGNAVQIRMIERVGDYYNEDLHPILINKKNDYTSLETNPTTLRYPQFFYVFGNKVGIVDADAAGTARMFYIRKLPKIFYGTVTVPTTTTVVIPATPDIGTIDDRNDYYNGAYLRIVSCTGGAATGAGQRLKITDYVASTRTLTVDAPTIAVSATTIKAEIVCEIPEEHHKVVALLMAMYARLSDKQAIEPDLKEMFADALNNLITGLVPRQSVESDHVHSPYR